jgi:hypothetical protein
MPGNFNKLVLKKIKQLREQGEEARAVKLEECLKRIDEALGQQIITIQ